MKSDKLIWIPRVLSIIFILFLSLFALDAFSAEAPFIQKLAGFFMHLIPSFILVIALVISWKRPVAGGCILIFLSLLFTVFFQTYRSFPNFLIISLPLAVIGVLFIVFNPMAKKKSP
jgi:hypothetical protein